jgi:NAD(P)-dependent dehydrogenase (short-subunit alcohol dehydrogenase family)
MSAYDLNAMRVLITGASSGIGLALAKQFAEQGAQLVIVARRRDRLEELADEIAEGDRRRPLVITADLSVRGQADRIVERVDSEVGGLDVLVNNAGGAVGGSVWAVGDGEEARADFEVDLWSPLALIAGFVPAMRNRGDGCVVNVTSIRQIIAWPSFGQNSAAQAALAQATETLRLELKRYGVHVVEVIPGPIETPAQGPTSLLPGIKEAIHDRLGTATPEEISALIVTAVEENTTASSVRRRPPAALTRIRLQSGPI